MGRRHRLMVVDDELIVRESLAAWLEKEAAVVDKAESGAHALALLEQHFYDILFVDIKMPGMDGFALLEKVKENFPTTLVVIITAYGTVEHAVQAMRLGANDFLVKPFDPDGLGLMLAKLLEHKRLLEEAQYLRSEVNRCWAAPDEIIGVSAPMVELFRTIQEVSASDSSILILGETGTGKELIARAIHASSKRIGGPFVPINCGAIPESLIESEIFGFEKGSFTGAIRPKKGLIEVAEGGTLFLDEVGEISPKMQVDLLRILQDRVFYRVGGVDPIRADFRLISATHRDLNQAIVQGNFRQDFFYRINVITLRIPPLRERRDDIPPLAEHFVRRFARETNRDVDAIDHRAMQILVGYDWPGNIRELENVVERAVVTARKRVLTAEAFDYLQPAAGGVTDGRGPRSLHEAEIAHIRRVLDEEGWNISHAAKVLEVDRTTLHKKLRKYDLHPSEKL
ncbi:MAG: sigma-54-dependent Fis family transcriptional regulator [Desulfomonile tiedjei]|nr:sigma-54-dependent Fis family transcriptional regulator [Desulfomonile tiedjei]